MCAVEFEELGEDESCWAGAEEEDVDADLGVEFIEAVDGTCGGFEEGRFFGGKVMDLVALLLRTKRRKERRTRSEHCSMNGNPRSCTYYVIYSAKPPPCVTPRASSSHIGLSLLLGSRSNRHI